MEHAPHVLFTAPDAHRDSGTTRAGELPAWGAVVKQEFTIDVTYRVEIVAADAADALEVADDIALASAQCTEVRIIDSRPMEMTHHDEEKP